MARLQPFMIFAGFILASGLSANGASAASLEARIQALEPAIGQYPADIKNAKAKREVKARYEALKRDLDAAVAAHPEDEKLLAERGVLQSMGHNFDYPGAWEGATKDLTAALKADPNDVHADLTLANLWVNSGPDLAKDAEGLFRAAQCISGDAPLEEAQRGLFFALYYQGRIREAYGQAQYLQQTWPKDELYASFVEIGRIALGKKGEPPSEAPIEQVMASCNDKPH